MNPPTISVVIPTYNRAHLIERAIASVLSQSIPVHEVVVVDDGSNDNTMDLLSSMAAKEPRLVLLSQPRAGAPAARNRGIGEACGSLIAFQDSDDEWQPTFIEELLQFHTQPGVVAFSSILSFGVDGVTRMVPSEAISDVGGRLQRENCISTQTALVDAALLVKHQFDERLGRLQDWDLWLSLIDEATFVHHPRPLVIQHLQSDSLTSGSASLYAALRRITRTRWRVLARSPRTFLRHWFAARLRLCQFWVRDHVRRAVLSTNGEGH